MDKTFANIDRKVKYNNTEISSLKHHVEQLENGRISIKPVVVSETGPHLTEERQGENSTCQKVRTLMAHKWKNTTGDA